MPTGIGRSTGPALTSCGRVVWRRGTSPGSSRCGPTSSTRSLILRALALSSGPRLPPLWGLQNVCQAVNGGQPGTAGADIDAVAAWDASKGSAATVVAAIDTGIDSTHPDLAPNPWSAPASFAAPINALARGECITRAENLIVAGPVGTGRAHLAIASGLEAVGQRRRVLFTRAAPVLEGGRCEDENEDR